jgi:hypothetical protein
MCGLALLRDSQGTWPVIAPQESIVRTRVLPALGRARQQTTLLGIPFLALCLYEQRK